MNGNIGEYWTLRNDLYPVWGYTGDFDEKEKKDFRVTGHLKLDDIDFNAMQYGIDDDITLFSSEKEIRGKKFGKNIKVVDCEEVKEEDDDNKF